jgi:hypothetical protein
MVKSAKSAGCDQVGIRAGEYREGNMRAMRILLAAAAAAVCSSTQAQVQFCYGTPYATGYYGYADPYAYAAPVSYGYVGVGLASPYVYTAAYASPVYAGGYYGSGYYGGSYAYPPPIVRTSYYAGSYAYYGGGYYGSYYGGPYYGGYFYDGYAPYYGYGRYTYRARFGPRHGHVRIRYKW